LFAVLNTKIDNVQMHEQSKISQAKGWLGWLEAAAVRLTKWSYHEQR
jgi:hypothetical protein